MGLNEHTARENAGPPPRRREGWLILAAGVVTLGLGLGLAWLIWSGDRAAAARASWPEIEGRLQEIAIDFAYYNQYGGDYALAVRYEYEAGGLPREGRWVDAETSALGLEAAAGLAAVYAPEARSVTRDDFSVAQPRKSWRLPFPGAAVRVRYDPNSPDTSTMLMPEAPPYRPAPSYVQWAFAGGLIVLGLFGLAAFAGINLDGE